MISIVRQTIDFYMKNLKEPTLNDIKIENKELLNERWSCFVTLYYKWNIRWSAWNIKEIKKNIIEEIISNTIEALTNDKRFKKITLWESKELKIRFDKISSRSILKDKNIKSIETTRFWVLVIKKDYEKMALLLPNIDPKILTWEDYIPILKEKLNEKEFSESDYIIYEIETITETDY